MEFMTVSEVSKTFGVSTRMLRYYEKMGLISCSRREDYAYRIYDEVAVRRLQQILVFRKLRIPLKQIGIILDDYEQLQALQVIRKNAGELDEEINALSTIRDILNVLITRLDEGIQKRIHLDLLEDGELIKIANALNLSKLNLKEEYSVEELNKASEVLSGKMDIRIVYLPAAAVVSSQYIGENPEEVSGGKLEAFIEAVNLPSIKPDFRIYGFNNPSPREGAEHYGYEFWATIPESLEVPEQFNKRRFAGGLYAAHCIKMGDFHEWEIFIEQMKHHEENEIDWREPEGMGGLLEEELNAYSYYTGMEQKYKQLDLLIPIKPRHQEAQPSE